MWQAAGWTVTVKPTNAPHHATQLAQEAAQAGHRLVLAAGGDGTLGEVASGLAGSQTIMAPLPVGTSNSFARELQMPLPNSLEKHKLLDASATLLAGKVQQMDMGWLEDESGHGRSWLLWTGTGVDGYLVDQIEPRPRWSKRLGRMGYFLQSAAAATHLPHLHATVEIDGRCYEGDYLLILISNCRLYAGGQLRLTPHAYLDDGLIELWLFQGQGLKDMLTYLWQTNRQQHHQHPNITHVNGRHITIHTSQPMPCQSDGDKAGHTPIHCHVKPGALRLLVPATAPPDLFRLAGVPLQEAINLTV